MDKQEKKMTDKEKEDLELNRSQKGVDKAPGEEIGKAEKVTKFDLKNKKIDADPEAEAKADDK
jgi:hypothetical protein